MAMNAKEKQYAIGRITQIADAKCRLIKYKHTVPAVILSSEQRLQAFRSGKYTLKRGLLKIAPCTYFSEVVDFIDERQEKAQQIPETAARLQAADGWAGAQHAGHHAAGKGLRTINSCVDELRENGLDIPCRRRGRVWYYRMVI
jgi:hypothetical protein